MKTPGHLSRWLLSTLLVVFACAGSEVSRTDHAPSSVHEVTHEPGDCELCDLYHDNRDSVVRIEAGAGHGSGVVVSDEGHIVTNAHVVGVARFVEVKTFDGEVRVATVLRSDPTEDLALLVVPSAPGSWKPVALLEVPRPTVGQEVVAIGHPLGLNWTLTRGVVSAYRRAGEAGAVEMIQTDAAISPGNSGGPLLDYHGHLIGIVTSKIVAPGSANLAFARPVSALRSFLAQGEAADATPPADPVRSTR